MERLDSLDLPVERIVGSKDVWIERVIATPCEGDKKTLFVGRKYFPEQVGAILTDKYQEEFAGVTQLIDPEPEKKGLIIASQFYGYPEKKLEAIGVTGTNGKTTTTYLIRHLLGEECGLIGTIQCLIGKETLASRLTTPNAIELQGLMSKMVERGCTHVAMEVSSHALVQGRTAHIPFKKGVFTNLTPDHLDYHGTMEEYAKAKKRLFEELQGEAIVNADDPYSSFMAPRATRYGIDTPCEWQGTDLRYYPDKTLFRVRGFQYELPLIGRYNVYNALAALAAASLSPETMRERLMTFKAPPGRMEPVPGAESFYVFIDFAHTEDGLRNALTAVRKGCRGRVIVVFGCGGDRDKEKRAQMGRVAEELADCAIITSDNPRSEDPEEICAAIAAGMTHPFICIDRKEAIEKGIETAREGDVVLIAGRGHETHQIIGKNKTPFSDYEIAKNALGLLK